jgi:hypothetical protein
VERPELSADIRFLYHAIRAIPGYGRNITPGQTFIIPVKAPLKEPEMRKILLLLVPALIAAPLAICVGGEARQAYQEKAAALAPDDTTGHYTLGLWCAKEGLADEARLEFERVIALDPDHEGARRELGYVKHRDRWLARDEAMRAKGLVLHEGRWLLPEEVKALLLPKSELQRKRQAQAKARSFLKKMSGADPKVQRIAMKALDGIDDRYKVEPLAYALRYPSEHVRTYAAKELGRIKDRRALRPLIHRSLMDTEEAVRDAALAAVKQFDDPNLLSPYVGAMFSENEALAANAAHAVGEMGEVIGIEYLVYKLRAHGGGVSRSHIYLANQLSFIQDFDVEVAQTAFIADPIVGILQEGAVLEARVIATERSATIVERRVIRSLKKLSGVDMGSSPQAWAKWWKENKSKLMAKK